MGKFTLKENEVLTCTDKSSYVFDYINQLESIGLEIILAYAYQSSTFTTTLYEKQVSSRNAKFQLAFNGIIFTCCAQFVILICILSSTPTVALQETCQRFLLWSCML